VNTKIVIIIFDKIVNQRIRKNDVDVNSGSYVPILDIRVIWDYVKIILKLCANISLKLC